MPFLFSFVSLWEGVEGEMVTILCFFSRGEELGSLSLGYDSLSRYIKVLFVDVISGICAGGLRTRGRAVGW